jgi:hypothetical protein
MCLSLAETTVPTATPITPWSAARFVYAPSSSIAPSRRAVRVSKQELREQFSKVIEEAFENCPTDSAQAIVDFIRDAKYKAAIYTFWKRKKKNEDLFEAGIDLLDPVIAVKGITLLNIRESQMQRIWSSTEKTATVSIVCPGSVRTTTG